MKQLLNTHLLSGLSGAALFGAVVLLTGMQDRAEKLQPDPAEILGHMKIVYLDDGHGGLAKTIRIEGVNLQIVNGLGATNGNPVDPGSIDPDATATNGLGNLIVGYTEQSPVDVSDRTGSHNVVVGPGHGYSSFGGLVVAKNNSIAAPYGVITGGTENDVLGPYSAIAGGMRNKTLEDHSSIAGGIENETYGHYSTVAGGARNHTMAESSAVGGGADCFLVGAGDWAAGKCYWCDF